MTNSVAEKVVFACRNRGGAYIALILLLMLVLGFHAAMMESVTYDEPFFYGYGRQILFDGTTSRTHPPPYSSQYNSKMSISMLNALPEFIAKTIDWKPLRQLLEGRYSDRYIYVGRFVTILCSFLLAAAVYFWSTELYGEIAGLIALTLYAFSPNILAHSKLVTVDLYTTGFIFVAVYCFWKYLSFPTTFKLFLSSLAFGMAQLTKYTAVHLVPIFIVLALLKSGRRILDHIEKAKIRQLCGMGLSGAAGGLVFVIMTILVVNIGFLFEKSFVPFGDYPLKSSFFLGLKPALDNVPVPFPFAYLQGLDWVKHDDETGTNYGNLYLLGELQTTQKEGWWYYYIIAFLLKSTLGFLAILCISFVVLIKRRRELNILSDEIFLIIPTVYFLTYFSLFFHTQIGLRFILPIYPFLFVFVSKVAWCSRSMCRKAVVFLLLLHSLSSVSYHPHYLSYFNELIGDRKSMYVYLADSNVDWGQNKRYLRRFLEKNPDIKMRPEEGTIGRIVVTVNDLVGIYDPEEFRWLRENHKPVGHIAYSYLIYDIRDSSN